MRPEVSATTSAFCSTSCPASRLVWPPDVVLVTTAPNTRSLVDPTAFSSRLPVAVTVPPPVASVCSVPASVTITRFASESTSDRAVSLVAVSVVPLAPTWFTLMTLSVPMSSAEDSVRNRPPVPVPLTSAANFATLTSRWLAPVPAPLPEAVPVVTIRSSSAVTFTVSVPLANASVIVEPLRPTSPVVVMAPSAMTPVADTLTLPLPVDSVAPWAIDIEAARTSTVPVEDVTTSAVAAIVIAPPATTLTWPLPASTSAFSASVPVVLSSRWPAPGALSAESTVTLPVLVSTRASPLATVMPATVPPESVTVLEAMVPVVVTRLTVNAATEPTLKLVLLCARKVPPALLEADRTDAAVSTAFAPVPMEVPATMRNWSPARLVACAAPSASASSTAPLATTLMSPVPFTLAPEPRVVARPRVRLPPCASMRMLPSVLVALALAFMVTAPAACRSRLCALPLAHTWPLALKPRSSADRTLMLPLAADTSAFKATEAAVPSANSALSNRMWPSVPVPVIAAPTVSAPSRVTMVIAPSLPATVTAFVVSAVLSRRCRPPLVVTVAPTAETRLRSGAAAVPAPAPATSVRVAVSPSTLGLLPVRLSVIVPAVAVKETAPPAVPPARMRLTARLPVAVV